MAEIIKYRFVVKRDTAANFAAKNTLLLEGEFGMETDTGKKKIGRGGLYWNDLPYDGGKTYVQGDGITIDVTDPDHPIINNDGVITATAGPNVDIDDTDPQNLIISTTLGAVTLKGRKSTYASLPSTGNTSGDAYVVDADSLIYVWDGTAWPASGSGLSFSGAAKPGDLEKAIAQDSPLAYWKLNEASGTSFFDSSGHGYTLTKSGTNMELASEIARILPADPSFKGLYITNTGTDGAYRSDRLGLSAPYLGDYTVEAIVYPLGSSGTRIIFALYSSGESLATNADMYFTLQSGVLSLLWEYGSGTNTTVTAGPSIGNLGVPFHVAAVRDSTAKTTALFLNGRCIGRGSYTTTTQPAGGSSSTVCLGNTLDGGNSGLMPIAHVAVFTSALSNDRIMAHARAAGFR